MTDQEMYEHLQIIRTNLFDIGAKMQEATNQIMRSIEIFQKEDKILRERINKKA